MKYSRIAGTGSKLPDKVVTVPQRLQAAGYATAAFGKWHNTPIDTLTPGSPNRSRASNWSWPPSSCCWKPATST